MVRRSILLTALVLAPLAVAMPAPAQAQFFGPPATYAPPPWEPEPLCQQWCAADYAPCDPPYFKEADRRCQVNSGHGRHNH